MANFTDCEDNLTCATLSGSNGIGVGLVTGTPNKIVVSASNIPNSALANNSININGTTIALGTTGSLAIGDITAVTAGTNLTGGGTSGSLTVSLTSSITGGLTNISGLTTLSSSQVSGTFSGSGALINNLTASNISNFTNDVRAQFSAGTNITINNGVISASGGSGGSGTINTGSAGYVTYYPSAGTTVDDASGSTGGLYWDNTNIRLGINTTSPTYRLDVAGTGRFTSNVEVTGTIKSTSTIYAPGIDLSNSTGYANIEIGGPSGGHIDLKRPYTDDYDIRLISDNNIEGGGYLLNAGGAILALSGTGVAVGQYSNAGYKLLVAGTTRLADAVEIGQSGTLRLYDNATQVVVQYPNKQVSFYDSTNTATRMLIDTNGNVGIGTTTPEQKLQVGNETGQQIARIAGGDSGVNGGSALYLGAGSGLDIYALGHYSAINGGAYNDTLTLYAADGRPVYMQCGNVGIGTSTPAYKLHVSDNINNNVSAMVRNISNGASAYSIIRAGNNTDDTAGLVRNSSTNTAYAGVNSLNLWQQNAYPIGFVTNNILRMFVSGNGNVGIGTSTPATKLDISTTADTTLRLEASTAGIDTRINSVGGAGNVGQVGTWSNHSFTLRTNDTERIRILNDGNVGIGISTPATKLDVNGEVTVRGNRILHSSSNYQTEFGPGAGIGTPSENYGIYAPAGKRLVLNTGDGSQIFLSGSNVGIGTSIPTYKLQVNGTISGTAVYGLSGSSTQFPNFTNDVRAQFTAGTNITITNGQIDATGGGVGTISPGNQYRLAYYSDVDGGTTINYASNLVYDNNALGIGYPPTGKYKLEVSGNGLFSKTVFTSLPATYFDDWMLQIHREQTNSALKESGHLVLTAPDADGTAAALYFGISGSTTNNTYSWIQSRLPTTDTGDERILSLNPNGGSVGIGTTTPNSAYKLDVAGTGRFTSNVEITGTLKAVTQLTASSISSSTNITTGKIYFTPVVSGFDSYLCIKNSNGEIVRETSDARLKENITYFDNQEMLNVALQLKPAKYSWIERENPEEIDVGFIAQDVLSVFPPAVGAEYQGYYGFKINKIIPVAIGAIKQLKQENDELKQKLNEVLTRLSALENK